MGEVGERIISQGSESLTWRKSGDAPWALYQRRQERKRRSRGGGFKGGAKNPKLGRKGDKHLFGASANTMVGGAFRKKESFGRNKLNGRRLACKITAQRGGSRRGGVTRWALQIDRKGENVLKKKLKKNIHPENWGNQKAQGRRCERQKKGQKVGVPRVEGRGRRYGASADVSRRRGRTYEGGHPTQRRVCDG